MRRTHLPRDLRCATKFRGAAGTPAAPAPAFRHVPPPLGARSAMSPRNVPTQAPVMSPRNVPTEGQCPHGSRKLQVLIAAQVARQGSSAPRARHSRAACRGQTDLWDCNQSNICPPRACWPRSISYRTAGAPVAQPRTPLRRAVAAREGSAADTTAARATRTPCVGILGVCLIPLLFPESCHSIPARHCVVPLSRN